MHYSFLRLLVVLASSASLLAGEQNTEAPSSPKNSGVSSDSQATARVPSGVILVKGAWPSASDSVTPVPEDGTVADSIFSDKYFGMTYRLPAEWLQKYEGPPPSEYGRYVLLLINPSETYKGPARGTILITADDLFFTPWHAANARQFVDYSRDHLQTDFKVEIPPSETRIAGHSFRFFAYWAPATQVHWYLAATEIRCHAVQFALTSRDPKLLETLLLEMNKMQLPAEAGDTDGIGGGEFPVCIRDYASSSNMISRVEPIFGTRRFNSVPVRIVIDKTGRVKHIHFLRAFPEQSKAITDALQQWKFRPFLRDGQPMEVETGLLFSSASQSSVPGQQQ
jgi:hypothetical protein